MWPIMTKDFSLLCLLSMITAPVVAQTWTDCNPMEKTCADDVALGIKNYKVDFTKSLSTKIWNHTNGVTSASSEGTTFQIAKRLQSPTIQSVFNIFFGSVEVVMKSAAGQGIISSIVIQSDNLDEIDWEWIGSNNTIAQSNYFGKGNQTSFDRAVYHTVATPNDVFHNYTINWTQDKIQWIIDSVVVRTLNYVDANGGLNFPQTPSTVRMGIWAGGDSSMPAGTVEWAQGATDYSKAPFNMIVKSAVVSDHSTGSAYHWSDKTGSFSSIKSVAGNSSVATAILNPSSSTADLSDGSTSTSSSASGSASGAVGSGTFTSSKGLTQQAVEKYQSLSTTGKVAVASGVIGGLALIGASFAFFCFRQRRKGAAARAEEAKRLELEAAENDVRYAGMGVKEQDALPMGAMTPAQYNRGDSGLRKQNTTYYGVNEIEGVEHDHEYGHWDGERPPPAYNGATYGGDVGGNQGYNVAGGNGQIGGYIGNGHSRF